MKERLISPYIVSVWLFAAIGASVLFIVLLWLWIDVEPVRDPYLNIEDLPFMQMHSVSDIDEVLERPLFWAGRQPVIPPEGDSVVAETVVITPLINVQLLGIVLTGDIRNELLKDEGKIISVQAGQVIQNWTVDKVTAKEVSFVAGDEQTELSLVRERPDSIQLETIK